MADKKPRAPKAPKAPATTEALVVEALKKAATKPGASWTAGSAAGLFNTKEANHQAAIEDCTKADRPLLKQSGKTGVLTADGYLRLIEATPLAEVAELALTYAANLDAEARGALPAVLDGRTSEAGAERFMAAADALRAEEERVAEERAKQAAQAKLARYRQAIVSLRATESRLSRELAVCRAERTAAERTLADVEAAYSAPAVEDEPEQRPANAGQSATRPGGSAPQSDADKDYRRDVADQLTAAWRDACDAGKDEGREFLETAIWNIRGMKQLGEVGRQVTFDGLIHESKDSLFTGDAARVVRPGWSLVVDDENYVPLKALVEKV